MSFVTTAFHPDDDTGLDKASIVHDPYLDWPEDKTQEHRDKYLGQALTPLEPPQPEKLHPLLTDTVTHRFRIAWGETGIPLTLQWKGIGRKDPESPQEYLLNTGVPFPGGPHITLTADHGFKNGRLSNNGKPAALEHIGDTLVLTCWVKKGGTGEDEERLAKGTLQEDGDLVQRTFRRPCPRPTRQHDQPLRDEFYPLPPASRRSGFSHRDLIIYDHSQPEQALSRRKWGISALGSLAAVVAGTAVVANRNKQQVTESRFYDRDPDSTATIEARRYTAERLDHFLDLAIANRFANSWSSDKCNAAKRTFSTTEYYSAVSEKILAFLEAEHPDGNIPKEMSYGLDLNVRLHQFLRRQHVQINGTEYNCMDIIVNFYTFADIGTRQSGRRR